MEQRLEERQKKLDQAADPPAPDIGGRAGNRKILSLFESSENSISLWTKTDFTSVLILTPTLVLAST